MFLIVYFILTRLNSESVSFVKTSSRYQGARQLQCQLSPCSDLIVHAHFALMVGMTSSWPTLALVHVLYMVLHL
jgi:hypothetical protein